MIDACLANDVKTMISASSDKAANPTNVMGATKLVAEKLVTAATNYHGRRSTTFASVRFGNVLGCEAPRSSCSRHRSPPVGP